MRLDKATIAALRARGYVYLGTVWTAGQRAPQHVIRAIWQMDADQVDAAGVRRMLTQARPLGRA